MKKINKTRSNFRRVHSMQELHLEKVRLEMEEVIAKERIKGNVREIREAFALRNIITTVVSELSIKTSVLSNVVSAARGLFKKRKKKRKEATEEGGRKTEV
jgi:hypothetical protein